MGLIVTVPPVAEFISLTAVKDHLRVDAGDTTQDVWLAGAIVGARVYVEKMTRRAMPVQTFKFTLDRFPLWGQTTRNVIRLPVPPVVNVVSIQYVDINGTLQTLDPSLYLVDYTSEPCRISPVVNTLWPQITYQLDAVTITFTAGYATPPQTAISAMLMIIGNWWEQREGVSDREYTEIPMSAQSILDTMGWGSYV